MSRGEGVPGGASGYLALVDLRAHRDAGLGLGGAGVAADRSHGVVEVVGVLAGDTQLVVEAAGEEGELAHGRQPPDLAFEVVVIGGRHQADVDERVEVAADAPEVDRRGVARDDTGPLQAADAVGGAVRAEADLSADARVGRPSISAKQIDDSVIDGVHRCEFKQLGPILLLGLVPLGRFVSLTHERSLEMRVGVPTEIKTDEYRVALTPAGARELTGRGHEVFVQSGAGDGSAIADADYVAQGAEIVADAEAVFAAADVVVKVKEPQAVEVALLEERHVLFTYLHLAPDRELTQGLLDSGATCIAYETVTDARGRLPLLAPMSEVAGKIAAQAGAFMLEKPLGGRGLLLGGVPGVAAGRVMVIGGGVVGYNAAQIAIGLGADVFVYDRSIDRLRELDTLFGGRASTCFASTLEIEQRLPEADLVVGAVLVQGAKAPRVLTRDQLGLMKPGAVLVDVSIDQGGCFETSRATTHSAPTYEVNGISHYCVANMPGAVPITSTHALTNATMPYLLRLVDEGPAAALAADPGFAAGLNVAGGTVANAAVASGQGRDWTPPDELLGRLAATA